MDLLKTPVKSQETIFFSNFEVHCPEGLSLLPESTGVNKHTSS